MARTQTKVEKFYVGLSEQQALTLRDLMAEDMQSEKSNYVGLLIVWEARRRREAREQKTIPSKMGRPRKDAPNLQSSPAHEENEEPRNIPHPDQVMNKGRLLTLTEYEAYNQMHS